MLHITEQMFSSGKPIAQGEVLIWMKKYAPKEIIEAVGSLNLTEMRLENGLLILGHSETGHHHVLEAVKPRTKISSAAQALIDQANDTFIELKLFESCKLVHMREQDNHKAYVLPPGDYICKIREEQSPQGWRKVAD